MVLGGSYNRARRRRLNGEHPGRKSVDEITLFDSTGVDLQDLAVAAFAAEIARSQGVALEVAI